MLHQAASSGPSGSLVGRATELKALARRLGEAREGRPRLVTVLGSAGMGKTSLLEAFLEEAAASGGRGDGASGLTVLSGRCPDSVAPPGSAPREPGAEPGGEFSGVRALFGSLNLPDPPDPDGNPAAGVTRPLLRGVTGHALAALDPRAGAARPASPEDTYAAMHGLYRLALNLMAGGCLLLVLDDVHRCDRLSLRWVDFLLRRSGELPLLVVLALRDEVEPTAPAALADLSTCGLARTVRLGPLGEEHAVELAHEIFGTPVEPEFAARAAAVSCGSPRTMRRLFGRLRDEGARPDRTGAGRAVEVGGQLVGSCVRDWFARHPDWIRDVATAAAVLGEHAEEHTAALAGISASAAREALSALRGAGLAEPHGNPGLLPEAVRSAVLAMASSDVLAQLRARAALLLRCVGRSPEEVARLLVPLHWPIEPWMRSVLRAAATVAERRGEPETAARYLERLLPGSPADADGAAVGDQGGAGPDDVSVRLQLARIVRHSAPGRAMRLLREAHAAAGDVRARGTAAVAYGCTALGIRQATVAAAVLEEALGELDAELGDVQSPRDRELRTLAESVLLTATMDERSTVRTARRRAARLDPPPGDTPGQRRLLAAVNVLAALDGRRTSAEVTEQARALLRDSSADPDGWTLLAAGFTFSLADETADCFDALDRLLARARRQQATSTRAFGLAVRSLALQRIGATADALTAAEEAVALTGAENGQDQKGRREAVALPGIALAMVLIDRDEPARGQALLDRIWHPRLERLTLEHHYFLVARARARWVLGRLEDALGDFLECGRSLEEAGLVNPSFSPWWADAASVLAALHRHDEIDGIAGPATRRAERWGTNRMRGMAELVRGVAAPGPAAVERFASSVRMLADSEARSEHARAELILGHSLLQAGDLRGAREQFHAAADHAQRCGILAIEGAARGLLVRAGGRVRRNTRAMAGVLTGTERKIADLAAAGASNRDIARSLFVTVRTVESHLTSAYRKLGVTRRAELGMVDRLDRMERAFPSTQESM